MQHLYTATIECSDGTGLITQVPLQLNNAALVYRCHGALRWDRSDYAGSTAAQ